MNPMMNREGGEPTVEAATGMNRVIFIFNRTPEATNTLIDAKEMVYPRHAVRFFGGCCIPEGILPTPLVLYFTIYNPCFAPRMYMEHLIAPQ